MTNLPQSGTNTKKKDFPILLLLIYSIFLQFYQFMFSPQFFLLKNKIHENSLLHKQERKSLKIRAVGKIYTQKNKNLLFFLFQYLK